MSRMKKSWENGVLEVSQEEVDKFLKVFGETLKAKLKKKGSGTFNSTQEVIGKLDEEFNEARDESHNRNLELFKDEMLDCSIVGFWGFVSANKWKKTSK